MTEAVTAGPLVLISCHSKSSRRKMDRRRSQSKDPYDYREQGNEGSGQMKLFPSDDRSCYSRWGKQSEEELLILLRDGQSRRSRSYSRHKMNRGRGQSCGLNDYHKERIEGAKTKPINRRNDGCDPRQQRHPKHCGQS